MADKITEAPELISPMQYGIDHGQHALSMRKAIADNAGESIEGVTPPDEVAENIIKRAQGEFLEHVAGVESPPDEASTRQDADPSERLSDLGETLNALGPGEGPTVRTTPSGPLSDLENKRNEKMTPLKETA